MSLLLLLGISSQNTVGESSAGATVTGLVQAQVRVVGSSTGSATVTGLAEEEGGGGGEQVQSMFTFTVNVL